MANVSRRTFIKAVAAVGVATASLRVTSTLYDAQSKDTQHDTFFNIGAIGPSTGVYSIYGIAARYGAQVAIDEINAKGIRKYKLNWQDTNSLPGDAPKCYQNLKEWGAQIVLGPFLSESAHAVAMRAQADDIFMLTPTASSLDVLGHQAVINAGGSERFSNVFMSCPNDTVYGVKAAEAIAKHQPRAKICVIYDDSNPYSFGIAQSFLHKAKELGLKLYCVNTFAGKSQNLSTGIEDAKMRGVDLLFLPLYSDQAASILKVAHVNDYHPVILGADGLDGIVDVEGLSPSLIEGIYYLSTFDPNSDTPRHQLFTEKYKQVVDGVLPDQCAAATYDAIYILDELIKNTQMQPDDSPDLIAAELKKQILGPDFKFSGLTGKDITWNEDGTCSVEPGIFTIQDGKEVKL